MAFYFVNHYHIAIIRPASKLHETFLLIKWKELYVDFTR